MGIQWRPCEVRPQRELCIDTPVCKHQFMFRVRSVLTPRETRCHETRWRLSTIWSLRSWTEILLAFVADPLSRKGDKLSQPVDRLGSCSPSGEEQDILQCQLWREGANDHVRP